MTLQEHISTFLRDSQFRVGEIGRELDLIKNKDSEEYNKLWDIRNDLCQFIDILYNARYAFIDSAYRFVPDEDETDWSESDLIAEIEYQRWISGVNEIPYITFTGYYPWLVNVVGSNGTAIGIPNGGLGQYLVYGLNNTVHAEDFPDRCGMSLGENINSYFQGRL